MPVQSHLQSHLRHPLNALLAGPGNVRVLRALALDRAPQSAPQLARLAGLSPQGSRLVLDGLVRQQMALEHGSGRSRLFELNRSHPLAGAFAGLFEAEARRWEDVLQSIRAALGAEVQAAWLYGSVSRGEDTAGSDLDIAVLVSSQLVADRLRESLLQVEDAQQVHISLAALTPEELRALAADDPWWSDVVRDARVLKGPAPEQARQRVVRGAK